MVKNDEYGYSQSERARKNWENGIARCENELIETDTKIQEYRNSNNSCGVALWEEIHDFAMWGYLKMLDGRYNLRKIISEARKREEFKKLFDTDEE